MRGNNRIAFLIIRHGRKYRQVVRDLETGREIIFAGYRYDGLMAYADGQGKAWIGKPDGRAKLYRGQDEVTDPGVIKLLEQARES